MITNALHKTEMLFCVTICSSLFNLKFTLQIRMKLCIILSFAQLSIQVMKLRCKSLYNALIHTIRHIVKY